MSAFFVNGRKKDNSVVRIKRGLNFCYLLKRTHGRFVKACKRSSETSNITGFDDGESEAPSSSSTVVEPRRSKRVNVSESVFGKNRFWAKRSKTLEHTLHRISIKKCAQNLTG